MKIGIDIRCLMAENYSGVAEYTYNLLQNIFKIDRQNQYLLFYNSSKNITENLPQFRNQNVKYCGFTYPNKIFNICLKLFKYPKIDRLIGNPDVFFVPNFIFTAFTSKTKKIITVHDLSFELFPNFFSFKRLLWHKIIEPKKFIKKSDLIITDSQNTKNDLVNYYKVPKNKIKIISLGVDTNEYKKIEQDDYRLAKVRKKYELPDNFILYLGTVEPRKNIEGIIEAFDDLKNKNPEFTDLNLVIAGDLGWKYKRVLQTAQNAKYTDNIYFIGYIKKQDKVFLYNLAQLLIFPSFYEGFGLPVLEAQACGLPVIASVNSSFPEIAGESALLINPDLINEISQAIKIVLTDNNNKSKQIQAGLNNARKFTWNKTATETLNIFTT